MAVQRDVGMLVKMNFKCFPGIEQLEKGQAIDETELFSLVDFVNARHDCADFRLICLIKALMAYRPLLSPQAVRAIEGAVLGFKYWMDEPGEDGMCYWSENHQLLFASCEYLAGQAYPERAFSNSGLSGTEHRQKARAKLLRWLRYKFLYGFIEWHSNTYYEEDIAPLCALIDHADDEELCDKAAIVLDLLFLDLALHSFEGYFVAASGRCYEAQKKDGAAADVNDILRHAFGVLKGGAYDYGRISALFLLCKNYRVPEAIKAIARARGSFLIKDSQGLDLDEVRREIPNDDFDDRGMFLWAMEAFTNPESIAMTMDIFNAWKLESNTFLRDLKMINLPVLRRLGLLPALVRILNPATRGVAIERANTQSYRCDEYFLSSAQAYHPGCFGDQQHIWQATLPGRINVFSTHPGSPMFDDDARNFSPSYWVGNGINPHAAQERNVLLLIYDLRPRKGFLERKRQKIVHFYLPLERFDELIRSERSIMCRAGESYLAIVASARYEEKNGDELLFTGPVTGYAVVLGCAREDGSFEAFSRRLMASRLSLQGRSLFLNCGKNYRLDYRRRFSVDGQDRSPDYARLDTPFARADRKPREIRIGHDGAELLLNFDERLRHERRVGEGESHAKR
ncbi:MAG TPA: hypothetical protein DCG47_08285 [Spirochaetaceae bacterium]|jgi:hypothetical protein|nr:hypothetical protein [Spirochaetaceae bacterium]